MKLVDYVYMIETGKANNMRPKKIHTETALDGSVGLWNSKNDKWSRNAKHPLSKSELTNVESTDGSADVVKEGVLGCIQGLPPINRIMQLAGLNSANSVVEEDTQELAEDVASLANLINQEYNKISNSADYRNKPDLAVIATLGTFFEAINALITKLPSTMPAGINDNMVTAIKSMPGIGATMLKSLAAPAQE